MDLPTGTVSFLFTDVEGSTRLLDTLGSGYDALLEAHRDILRSSVEDHAGVVFGIEGDAVSAVFASAGDAVAAAGDAQRRLTAYPWPEGGLVRVRMAVHTGDTRQSGDGYFGMSLHVTARVCSAGHGGQVLLTGATRALVPGCEVHDLGEHRLKDLTDAVHIGQLLGDGLADSFPALRTLTAMPNNLPASTDGFIGRTVELADVIDGLASHRLVTLTGAGGTGKTRLAIEAAGSLLGSLRDGAWLVELAPLSDMSRVPAVVALALGASLAAAMPERTNLRAAMEWAIERGDLTSALRLVSVVPMGLTTERRALIVDLLARGGDCHPPIAVAGAQLTLANLAFEQGDWTATIAAGSAARAGFEQVGDRLAAAWSTLSASYGSWGAGDLASGDRLLAICLREFRALDDRYGLAQAVWSVSLREPDRARATAMAVEAVERFRELGSPNMVAHALEGRALVELNAGDVDAAAPFLSEAVALLAAAGNLGCTAHSLEAVAVWAAARGDGSAAGELVGAADMLREVSGAGHKPWEVRARHSDYDASVLATPSKPTKQSPGAGSTRSPRPPRSPTHCWPRQSTGRQRPTEAPNASLTRSASPVRRREPPAEVEHGASQGGQLAHRGRRSRSVDYISLAKVMSYANDMPTLTKTAELASELRLSVMRLTRRLRAERPDIGLSLTQMSALGTIDRHGPMTPREVADHERVRPPSMTRVLALLEQRELIVRIAHPSDGRQQLVSLAPAGHDLLREDRRRREAWLAVRLAELTCDERAVLRAAMSILDRITQTT